MKRVIDRYAFCKRLSRVQACLVLRIGLGMFAFGMSAVMSACLVLPGAAILALQQRGGRRALGRWMEAVFLEEQPVSLIVSDQSMEEIQGIDLLRGVMLRSPGTTCVMPTGFPSVNLKKECEHLGIRELIEKPWDDDDLRRTVRRLLREREV